MKLSDRMYVFLIMFSIYLMLQDIILWWRIPGSVMFAVIAIVTIVRDIIEGGEQC